MALVSNERAIWLAQHVLPCEGALRAWLSRRPNLPADVDDIIQETYAILAGLSSTDHIQNPRAYMFEVAKSVILQVVRRGKVIALEMAADAGGLEIPDTTPSPETVASDRQELSRLAALIAGLPGRCREAITLRKVHGLSQREVARRMGVSENTVEKHIGKGLGLIASAMGRGGKSDLGASWKGEANESQQRDAGSDQRRRR